MQERLCELDVELSHTREALNDLEQRMVRSPDRIQTEIKEKENELEAKRNEKRKLEKQYMELMRTVEHLREASKSLKPPLETFTEAFKEIEKIRNQCEILDELKAEKQNKEKKLKELQIQLREHEQSLATVRQQMVNTERQYQQRFKTTKQLNDGLKTDLEAKMSNQTSSDKQALEERIKLEKRLDSLKLEHDQFKNKSEDYFKRHLEGIQNVKNEMQKSFNELKNSNKKI